MFIFIGDCDFKSSLCSFYYSVCDIVQAFLDRFEALPAIKTYMSSSEFIKWPINNKIAKWGGGASP